MTSLLGRSEDVLPELFGRVSAFDWIFIDIDHRYESTMAHLALLAERVRPGGWLIFDDINYSDGMRRAWEEIRTRRDFQWSTLHWHDRPASEPRMGVGHSTRAAATR